MNRFFSTLLLLMLPGLLFSQAKLSSKNFKVLSATKESWNPGTVTDNSKPGGGALYQVRLMVKKNGTLRLDSLVMAEGSLPVEVTKNTVRNYKGPLKKGDEIVLVAYQNFQEPLAKNPADVQSLMARIKKSKASCFVSYREKGNKCLVLIGEFQKKTSNQSNQ
jgi:hypothetical protein